MGLSKKLASNYDEDLRNRVGHDATSDFETDPNFTNNTANASSENLGASMEDTEGDKDDESSGRLGQDDSASEPATIDAQDEVRPQESKPPRSRGKRKTTHKAA